MQGKDFALHEARKERLGHEQQVEVGFGGGDELAWGDGHPPVVGKQKIVINVTLATQPEMFDVDL